MAKIKQFDKVLAEFCESVGDEIEELSSIKISGFKIDRNVSKFLVFSHEDFDEHVRKHPALIAFWTAKELEVKSNLEDLKSKFEAWERKQYKVAHSSLIKKLSANAAAPTVQDVRASVQSKHDGEWREKRKEVMEWEQSFAWVSAIREAVMQKGFSLQAHARMFAAEKNFQDSI